MADFRTVARRSALYVPGANQRALDKAREVDADVLIFDLEDAVHPDRKDLARDQVIAALRKGGYRAETVVRINPLSMRCFCPRSRVPRKCAMRPCGLRPQEPPKTSFCGR